VPRAGCDDPDYVGLGHQGETTAYLPTPGSVDREQVVTFDEVSAVGFDRGQRGRIIDGAGGDRGCGAGGEDLLGLDAVRLDLLGAEINAVVVTSGCGCDDSPNTATRERV
jgi:hypothetical protein